MFDWRNDVIRRESIELFWVRYHHEIHTYVHTYVRMHVRTYVRRRSYSVYLTHHNIVLTQLVLNGRISHYYDHNGGWSRLIASQLRPWLLFFRVLRTRSALSSPWLPQWFTAMTQCLKNVWQWHNHAGPPQLLTLEPCRIPPNFCAAGIWLIDWLICAHKY